MKEKTKILLFLSPIIGEMISSSSSPLEFFNSITFLFLWGLYGGGVVIIRELWIKWGKECTRLMFLGLVYGIF